MKSWNGSSVLMAAVLASTALAIAQSRPTGPIIDEPSLTPPIATKAEAEAKYRQALAMEKEGKMTDAVRLYRRVAYFGHGEAAFRLGVLYEGGVPGVPRDYAESMKWYEKAKELGIDVAARKNASARPDKPAQR